MLLIFKILDVERLQSIKFCTRLLFPTRRKCTRQSFSVNIVTHYAQCQCSLETETSIDNERGRKRKWNFEVWDSGKRRQAWNYENTKISDNPSVLSDKGFRIIAIIWTSRIKPINRDFLACRASTINWQLSRQRVAALVNILRCQINWTFWHAKVTDGYNLKTVIIFVQSVPKGWK